MKAGKGSTAGRLDVLKGIAIFSGLAEEDLGILASFMRDRSFPPGVAMFREGEAGDELFVVSRGLVAVTLKSQDAQDIEVSRVGPGAFFGEMSLLERVPRSATCTALEATDCLVLKAADFEALLAEAPRAAAGILERMLGVAAGRLLSTGSLLSQLVQWGDEARRRAITDPATGLFNRRYLDESFEATLARAGREGRSLSYAMFDLDRFGKLNAAYGAEFCDRMIVRAAAAMKQVFDGEDILVRYGGDEFCFLLMGEMADTEARCEALCQALRTMVFEGQPSLRISCSLGLAHFPSGARNGEELRDRADKALYLAKEGGRDRTVAWPGITVGGPKADIPTVAAKNRAIANISRVLQEGDDFLIAGHKDPDEDCVSSMVAFALLVTKFGKKATISLGPKVQDNYDYLLNICRYNSIAVLRGGELPRVSTLVLVDTPKPSMVERGEVYEGLRCDPGVRKIELDHHLGADSRYYGDPGYRLVYEASSTCEIIGYLALKLAEDPGLLARFQIEELLSRNLVLAILSGMIGDSQMGRYLKSRREKWFYARFSAMFERMLSEKTRTDSGNFSSKEQVFEALENLSGEEDACFRLMAATRVDSGPVSWAVLDKEASRQVFATYGNDTVVAMAKALVDRLAEGSGRLGLVGYYDDPGLSSLVQFRLRRSQAWTALDLRDVLPRLGITNGGGHPGAVGLRLEKDAVGDIALQARQMAEVLAAMVGEAEGPVPAGQA